MSISGGCLCGSVRYETDAKAHFTAVCHCSHCQKSAGSAFSVIIAVPEASVAVEGEESLSTYHDTGDSGGKLERRFCKTCGSPVISKVEHAPGVLFIRGGSLDDDSWVKPTLHMFCDSAQPWVEIPEDVKRFPRGPKG